MNYSQGFSVQELSELDNCLQYAFEEIKDVSGKSDDWIQGEVYTRVRQQMRYIYPSSPVNGIFKGQLRYMGNRLSPKQREQLVQLYNKNLVQSVNQKAETPEGTLEELKMIVAEANRSVQAAELSAKNAETCANSLAKVEKFLQGEDEDE